MTGTSVRGVPGALLGLVVLLTIVPARVQGSFVNFESGHVRPLALSPDGTRLFAVNTPDDRLAIYTVGARGLTLAAEVVVGLEPVTVVASLGAPLGGTPLEILTFFSDTPRAPARLAGTPPSTAKTDTTAKFLAQENTPPPAVCPPVP